MKKRISVLLLVLIMVTLSACSGSSASDTPAPQGTIEKDVTMLLKGIGDSMDMVESLGALPEAQVNGNLYYYSNASTEGYFAGFDLGIETEADGQTVKQIYIQPIGDAKITANGLVIGGTIADAKAVLGDGELSLTETNGKIVNFMIFSDEIYSIKATVEDQDVIAGSFAKAGEQQSPSDTSTETAVATKPETDSAADGKTPEAPSESVQNETVLQPEVFIFDCLLSYLGEDFSEVEKEMGSEYDRVEEEYEDLAIYREDGFAVVFGIDYESNQVTTIGLSYDSLEVELDGNLLVGMGGVALGMPAKDVAYNQAVYGDYAIYVTTDVNNVVCSIQAGLGYPDFVFEAPEVVENPADGGYKLAIKDYDTYSILRLTYNTTGETVELINTKGRTDGDRFFDGMNVKILNAKASRDWKTIYFETDDPKMTSGYGASNNTIFKYDLKSGYEENLCLGFLEDTVKVDSYEDYVIITYYEPNPKGGYYEPYVLIDQEGTYTFLGTSLEADLGDQIRRALNGEIDEYAMADPAAESIYGEYVNFAKYSAVVVEDYQGVNKDKFINEWTIQNPYYKDDGQPLYPCNFAVFGTIYNLRWKVGVNMDESETYHIVDELSDTYVTYETRRPGDMSIDVFLFEDKNGKEYQIIIEDMSDNIDLVMIP